MAGGKHIDTELEREGERDTEGSLTDKHTCRQTD